MRMGIMTLMAFGHIEALIWACAAVAVLPPFWMIARKVRWAASRRRRLPATVISLEHRRRARRR